MTDIVQKLWGFCHTLRHDGVDYGDYIEQITYLLFLKMADERGIKLNALTYKDARGKEVECDCSWPTLAAQSGMVLLEHYGQVINCLGRQTGILGDIYAKSQNRFNNPVNLKRLIGLIDETDWTSLDVDVKAAGLRGPAGEGGQRGQEGRWSNTSRRGC